ncbi:MAG TPA: hypothetical protein VGD59_12615 [Acidisarcina sp.]
MFPTGAAGAALAVLRILVASALLLDGTAQWALVTSFWTLLMFALPASLIVVGFLTPYSASIALLLQVAVLMIFRQNAAHLVLSILDSGILAVVGPGAYSIDARIFGRQLVRVNPRK